MREINGTGLRNKSCVRSPCPLCTAGSLDERHSTDEATDGRHSATGRVERASVSAQVVAWSWVEMSLSSSFSDLVDSLAERGMRDMNMEYIITYAMRCHVSLLSSIK